MIDTQDYKAWKKDKVTKLFMKYLLVNKDRIENSLHSQHEMLRKDGQKRFCIYLGGLEIVNSLLELDFETLEGLDNEIE